MPKLRLADHVRIHAKTVLRELTASGLSLTNLADALQMTMIVQKNLSKFEKMPEQYAFVKACAIVFTASSIESNCPVVIADNTAHRYMNDLTDRREKDEAANPGNPPQYVFGHKGVDGDIAQATPAFDRCFVEWKWPERVPWDTNAQNETMAGLQINTIDLRAAREPGSMAELLLGSQNNTVVAQYPDARWLVNAFGTGLSRDGRVLYSKYNQTAVIDPEGRVVWSGTNATEDKAAGPHRFGEHRNLYLAFHVFNFLHCRNISCVPTEGIQQSAKWHRRQKLPEIKYYTLRVTKKVRGQNESVLSSVAIDRAEHICRGHFREYTDEKPLFGQHAGRFWIAQHIRGTKEAGEVRKRYADTVT